MLKKISIIFGFIFMAAILAAAIWINIQYSTKDIVGTFCTGEGISREDVSGKYKTNKYEHISALDLEMTDGRQTIAIFDNHDTLILVEEFIEDVAYPIEFKRISNTPMIINVTDIP